ncbi:MAG: hypothetical protein P8Y48_10180 [Novosphingobium sp.]
MEIVTYKAEAENQPVQQVSKDEIPWLPYQVIPNTYFRVLQVDEGHGLHA